jgi:uncharacterized protein
MATTSPDRIITLDVIRGIAVMGIFSVNIVGIAMIDAAYMNPTAPQGYDQADVMLWAANYVLIDGKMRSLFSMLFGASMLLVIDRASASGQRGWEVHFRRMAVLALLGLFHYWVIWYGDILFIYAMTGMAAFFLRKMRIRNLLLVAALLFVWHVATNVGEARSLEQVASAARAPGATGAQRDAWQEATNGWATETDEFAAAQVEHYRAPFIERVSDISLWGPYYALKRSFPETLALMLLGMAAFRSGFLGGAWSNARYRRIAIWGIALGGAGCAMLAWAEWSSNFYAPLLLLSFNVFGIPFQLLMALGYAARIVLLTRRAGWLRDRVAAVGRAAFTNYLLSNIVGTLIFYGGGLALFGALDRVHVWLFVPCFWIAMLAWSKPWLDHFVYGPFEWLWRSLSRWKLQPMRKSRPAPAA